LKASELFELADVGKHGTVLRAVVVNKGHGRRWFAGLGHGRVSFLRHEDDTLPADFMPTLTEQGHIDSGSVVCVPTVFRPHDGRASAAERRDCPPRDRIVLVCHGGHRVCRQRPPEGGGAMTKIREAAHTVAFVDDYGAHSPTVFANMRHVEQFTALHLGLLVETRRKSLPRLARTAKADAQ